MRFPTKMSAHKWVLGTTTSTQSPSTAAKVYIYSSGTYSKEIALIRSPGYAAPEISIDIYGTYTIIGSGLNAGAGLVWIYGAGGLEKTLTSNNGDNRFGHSVAMGYDGNLSVYVSGSMGIEHWKATGTNVSTLTYQGLYNGDLGVVVADDSGVLMGFPAFNSNEGQIKIKHGTNDFVTISSPTPGVANYFGNFVTRFGNWCVTNSSLNAMRIYIGTTLSITITLPLTLSANSSIVMTNNHLFVGYPQETVYGFSQAGVVYVYKNNGGVWGSSPYTIIENPTPVANDHFGSSMAAYDTGNGTTRVYISSPGDDNGTDATNGGAFFTFDIT
jgi:hypothetical protein